MLVRRRRPSMRTQISIVRYATAWWHRSKKTSQDHRLSSAVSPVMPLQQGIKAGFQLHFMKTKVAPAANAIGFTILA